MAERVIIEWPQFNTSVRARLLIEKAPEFCSLFLSKLPFKSFQWHAVISGENMGFPFPAVVTKMENPADRDVGDLYFYANGQLVAIPYGETTEPCRVNKFGEIEKDDFEKLNDVGEKILQSFLTGFGEAIDIIIRKEGE